MISFRTFAPAGGRSFTKRVRDAIEATSKSYFLASLMSNKRGYSGMMFVVAHCGIISAKTWTSPVALIAQGYDPPPRCSRVHPHDFFSDDMIYQSEDFRIRSITFGSIDSLRSGLI